jgi:cytoskeletal protein CcmA (bactofilin family)
MLPTLRKSDTDKPAGTGSLPSAPLGTRPTSGALRGGDRGAPSVIGPDLLITGNLISRGEVQVDGEVQGDIHATNIVVGDKARITGGIVADEVVVRGHVMGSVRGKRVLLQNSSHVEGDVYHQTLAIEQGAFFEGKSRRTEDPTAGMGRFDPPAPPPPPAA